MSRSSTRMAGCNAGTLVEVCNVEPCDTDCVTTPWVEIGACSATSPSRLYTFLPGGSTLRRHAVNVDVSESDLAALDPAEVAAAVSVPDAAPRAAASALAPAEQEKRQALWWYLLIVVFGLLLTEAVLANRRTVRPAIR